MLVEPANAELATKLGRQTSARWPCYDLVVAGSGPAGLTSASYPAREGLSVLVIERSSVGGQVGVTERSTTSPASRTACRRRRLSRALDPQAPCPGE
ncbi:MAG: hypothetical protein NVS3B26_27480 [Mycobacteriales bacterium]